MSNILIVDDSADTRDFCELIARMFNMKVVQAINADDARRRLSKGFVPGLILLDIMMPGTPAADFVKWLRQEPAIQDSKVIVISATRDVARQAAEMGADGSLRKPFDMATFVDEMRRQSVAARQEFAALN